MTNQAVLSLPQADSFRELTAAVLERTRNPVDKYEIAATLESMGWNDKMAGRRFGAADVFPWRKESGTASKKIITRPRLNMPEQSITGNTSCGLYGVFCGAAFSPCPWRYPLPLC